VVKREGKRGRLEGGLRAILIGIESWNRDRGQGVQDWISLRKEMGRRERDGEKGFLLSLSLSLSLSISGHNPQTAKPITLNFPSLHQIPESQY